MLLLVGFTKHRIPLETQDFGCTSEYGRRCYAGGIIEADDFSPSRTRAIIARVRHLLCHARLWRGHSTHIRACPKKRYVFLVQLIGMACLSPRLQILVGFLQRSYIIFMMVGLRQFHSCYGQDELLCEVTNANGIDLVQLKTGKAKKGIYNIQHINSYHSQLKRVWPWL